MEIRILSAFSLPFFRLNFGKDRFFAGFVLRNEMGNCYTRGMNRFEKAKGHLKTINQHKVKVTQLCFQCGLYKQGVLHDLSKYTPCELKTGFRYYQGFRSPIDAQKEKEGYSYSWLHHKGRNPHHWEFWIDHSPKGVIAQPMPFNYVAEMFCDRVAASMIYQKDKYSDASALNYYLRGKDHMLIHEQSRKELEYLLNDLADHGLEVSMNHLKKMLAQYRKTGKSPIQ